MRIPLASVEEQPDLKQDIAAPGERPVRTSDAGSPNSSLKNRNDSITNATDRLVDISPVTNISSTLL